MFLSTHEVPCALRKPSFGMGAAVISALLILACGDQGREESNSTELQAASGGSSAETGIAQELIVNVAHDVPEPFVPAPSPSEHCYVLEERDPFVGGALLHPKNIGAAWPARSSFEEPSLSGQGGASSHIEARGLGGAEAAGHCAPYLKTECEEGTLTRREWGAMGGEVCCYELRSNGTLDCGGAGQCRPLDTACDEESKACCLGSNEINFCSFGICRPFNPR